MTNTNVLYDVKDHAAWLTMNRPEVLNALSKGMFQDLEIRLRDASKDADVYFIGIRGSGRAFSAGLDVKEVSGFRSHQEARKFVYGLVKPFWERYFACEKPVISVVDGPAFGAGAEIALASDLVVASKEASFAFSGGKVGALCCISAGFGQVTMTGRKAVEMNLTGIAINAEDALSTGLVNYAEDPSNLDGRVAKILQQMRRISPTSNASFKRVRRGIFTTSVLNTAYKELLRTITSSDFKKGAAAFARKTPSEYYPPS